MFSATALAFLPNCRPSACSISVEVDAQQLGEDAVVDHVPHEAAQLGVRAHRRDQLVERHGIEHQVGAQRVQLQRLVVDDRGAGIQRQHVLLCRLRIHRDEEVDFLLAGDVAALAGPDRVPGRQAGDVRREHVLARHRHAHQQNRPQQDQVRGLAARSVDGGDLNAEIVDDALSGGRPRAVPELASLSVTFASPYSV